VSYSSDIDGCRLQFADDPADADALTDCIQEATRLSEPPGRLRRCEDFAAGLVEIGGEHPHRTHSITLPWPVNSVLWPV
jgi:hypothetical protein